MQEEAEQYLDTIADSVAGRARDVAILEAMPAEMLAALFGPGGVYADPQLEEYMRRIEAGHRQAAEAIMEWRAAVAGGRRRVEAMAGKGGGR